VSLVSEALRKARREAAERKRPSRLPAPLPEPASSGRSTRFGAGLVVGASIALAAALLGAAATWWVVARPSVGAEGQVAAETPVVARIQAVGVAPPGPAVRGEPTPTAPGLPAPPVPTGAPGSHAAEQSRLAEPGQRPFAEPPLTAGPTPRPVSNQPDPAGPPSPPAVVSSGERAFVLEADLGYARLSLGFVVARPTDPFAEVNGQEVHVGSVVDGFTVEEITDRGVTLRDARGPLELKLR